MVRLRSPADEDGAGQDAWRWRYIGARTGRAMLDRCWKECRAALKSWKFWLGITMSFPAEHFLWEKIWPFYLVTHWIGL